jgi:outer membrane protein insertion porin family
MRIRPRSALWAAAAVLLASTSAAQVQVDALTEVRSIRFEGVRSIHKNRLESEIHTRGRGSFYGVRTALGKLPVIPPPTRYPFRPLTLQEDVVRLRRAYAAAGFYNASVRYNVVRDGAENLLDVTFVVDEGAPAILVDVTVQPWDSLAMFPIPSREKGSWEKLERSVLEMRGRRLIAAKARDGGERLTRWWRDRGYPRAVVQNRFTADSARTEARLTYRIATGAFARFAGVEVEGNRSVGDATIRRQVNIDPGDTYSSAALKRAELDLQELSIIRIAKVEVPSVAADTAVAVASLETPQAALEDSAWVQVHITEADRRLVEGNIGYVTDAGVTSEARWIHRNFTGGGRSLTATALAQTGWLALVEKPDERYRFSLSMKQPGFLHRRLSAALTPFVEHRDDSQDRSTQVGTNATLIYKLAAVKSVLLDYQIARRYIDEYRFDDLASGDIDLYTFLTHAAWGLGDSLGTNIDNSAFTLSANLGALDDAANPRLGFILRPAVQVTAPTSISSSAYWRTDISANGFVPLGHTVVLAARARVGHLYPYGKSLPGPGEDPRTKFLQLHDVSFTAGGSGDVRGWESRMLGPKVPDVRFERDENDSLIQRVDGYVPVGGFQNANFSLEFRLPLPGLNPNFGSLLFLDGGRVWTDDARYGLKGDPHGQEKFFFATGAGLSLKTPVGPILIALGYKLNPSVTDLVDAKDIAEAADLGRSVDDLPEHKNRRWQWHLAFGTSY